MPKTALPKRKYDILGELGRKSKGYAKYTTGRGIRWETSRSSLKPTDSVTKKEA